MSPPRPNDFSTLRAHAVFLGLGAMSAPLVTALALSFLPFARLKAQAEPQVEAPTPAAPAPEAPTPAPTPEVGPPGIPGPVPEVPAGPPPRAGRQPVVPRVRPIGGVDETEAGAEKEGEKAQEIPRIILPRSKEFLDRRIDIAPGEIEALEFIRFIADYTGLPVIIDSSNPQAFRNPIIIPAPIKDATAEIVVAILENNRFTITREVLPSGETVLNVSSAAPGGVPAGPGEPKGLPLVIVQDQRPILLEPTVPREILEKVKPDQIATMAFRLKYVLPSEATRSLNSLLGGPKGARPTSVTMAEVEKSMLVIVTAKFGMLPFIQQLIELIDIPTRPPERILQIINVENADADELAQLIQQFLQGRSSIAARTTRMAAPAQPGAPGAPAVPTQAGRGTSEYPTNIIADWRTQKIIVETYSERDLEDILLLVRELDTRFDIRRLRTRIYQVKYLKAEEVAADLTQLLGAASGYSLSGRAGLGTRTQTTRTPRTRGVARVGQRGITTGAAGQPAPGVPTPGGGAAGALGAPLIVPHVQTNSLIIQAEPEEYAEILNILEQIDVKRRQVFLEAALVEVSSSSNLNYTIELLAGEPNDIGTRLLFESTFGLSGIDIRNWTRALPDSLSAEQVPPGGLLALMHRGKFPALVQFFKSNSDSQVLATPFILADDNQTNVIDVLETIFVMNTATGANQITTTSQEGEDAGITLEITPTISSQNAVFLELSLEVSQFTGQGTAQVLPPKTTNTITSAVTIPDGEIFVIGGLTRENRSKSISKVPLLGDIPLLGKLFRSESTSKSASNLYIFLRAHILTHPTFQDGIDLTKKAERMVYDFAPSIEIMRFDRPLVAFPPKPPEDPDRPMRRRIGRGLEEEPSPRQRSRRADGYEAPAGPFESPTAQPQPRPEDWERTEAPAPSAKATPGGIGPAPEIAAEKAPSAEKPPEERGGVGQPKISGGLPALEPPPEGPEEKQARANADPSEVLSKFGLEIDPSGESWIFPVRPASGAVTPRR